MEIVPPKAAERLHEIEPYSGMVLIGLIVLGSIGGTSVLGRLVFAPAQMLLSLMLGGQSATFQ